MAHFFDKAELFTFEINMAAFFAIEISKDAVTHRV